MRSFVLICVIAFAAPAGAHIKLTSPGSFQVTDALGNPNKAEPCGGAGTATGVVTTVEAGSQLTVTWTEPILHPGHFRIGIATNESQFVTPVPVLTAGPNCSTAPIESPVAYPTLVDGLFPHTTAPASGSYTTTVTVPMLSCDNCRLQLMQFMSAHGPPCFYYQCATLRIVMPDAGQPTADAGRPAADAGTTDAGAGGGTGGGAGTGGGSATGGGSGSDAGLLPDGGPDTGGMPVGCGCTSAPVGALAFALAFALALRRSRRSRRA